MTSETKVSGVRWGGPYPMVLGGLQPDLCVGWVFVEWRVVHTGETEGIFYTGDQTMAFYM